MACIGIAECIVIRERGGGGEGGKEGEREREREFQIIAAVMASFGQ